jgi:hypothetical protein
MNLIHRKKIAWFLLAVFSLNLLAPVSAWALTSGPSQPETKGFQPAGVSDMVDLQSGSLKYNIPVLDIDGYPLNLNYQSGSGLDDEASWVGLGWTLNPGAINRQVRGIPDDFFGDEVETDHYTKPKVTVGGRLTAKVEIKGGAKLGGTFSFGIFSDNYTGIGAELGVNAGISYSLANSSLLTGGLGAGVMSNTQSGVDASVSPYVSLSVKTLADDNLTARAGISGSLGYNSRSGLKALGLGTSFGYERASYSLSNSSISYNTEPVSPAIQIPYKTTYGSFSLDVGGAAFGAFVGAGGTGYQNVREIKSFINKKGAYGYLYAERGKNNPDAVMDFIREKDNPVVPNLPNLAIPIHLPDVWSYTSQTGGGQFRLYRGGSGAFFDNQATDESHMDTYGADFGVGAYFHGGLTRFEQETKNVTRKWTGDNDYLANGDFQDPNFTNPKAQHVYFKKVGENSIEDKEIFDQTGGSQPVGVNVTGIKADAKFKTISGLQDVTKINKTIRRPNRTVISYLTASEATKAGLETMINTYPNVPATGVLPAHPVPELGLQRVDSDHKAHHISEVNVLDESGKRMVYGIPTYNKVQEEYTFAVGGVNTPKQYTNNQVAMPLDMANSPQTNQIGTDSYYHMEKKAPYATGYLLTAVLSPDYVDKTSNGVTDDDLGTAIQFHYTKLPNNYRWRTPYEGASLNRSQLADPEDDKGSIVYGEKELWYINSIESKTKVAYFILEDRKDGLGALNRSIGGKDLSNKQKRLKEIRLYSKADMTRPIKVVKFSYTYELCKGVANNYLPNSADWGSGVATDGGKLTLKQVWFEYGNTSKGNKNKYTFTYNNTANGATPSYNDMLTDRWGTYKNKSENGNGLDNSSYPYTNQNKPVTDQNAALWQLSTIGLPTGGKISVDYESGDYAYVQDKKATVMQPVQELIQPPGAANLYAASGFKLNIGTDTVPPVGADQTAWFKNTFLNGADNIYTKFKVRMSPQGNPVGEYDYVPCYAKVQSVSIDAAGIASITLVPSQQSGVTTNPICMAAWQKLKNEYPRYAYLGYNNRVISANNSFTAAVTAIISAAKNLSELRKNFYQKAKGNVTEAKVMESFVRITKVNGKKLGGSVRVKQIKIEDNWNTLSGNAQAPAGTYGQAYTYTTSATNGKVISSGVATYEPSVGNDENALKQPIFYDENIKGGISNYFNMELPFCESLYPAPSVGYSKVTVRDLGPGQQPSDATGWIVNEFYTAKDYPVQVKYLTIQRSPTVNTNNYSLVRSNSVNQQCLSQGYMIELNDMHGKAKANRVYNQSGAEISSTVYYYNSKDNNDTGTLDNNVNVISPTDLKMNTKVLGRDMEFYTDFREQESNNTGTAINIGGDVFPVPIFLPFFPLPHNPKFENNDYKIFRSVSALKVVQQYGILNKVVKTQNGSSITTQNIAFDELTGEPVITRTQNEFKKDIFSVNIPAYWAYKGMGGAYQNLGVLLTAFTTNANGEINNYSSYLQAGDEIVDMASTGQNHYWVIDNAAFTGGGITKKLIDQGGIMKKSYLSGLVKIVRSGFRNMLTDKVTTLVCLNNPISSTGYLQLNTTADLTALKVINASASTFDESWGANMPAAYDPTVGLIEKTDRDFSLASTVPTVSGLIVHGNLPSQDVAVQSSYWGGNTLTNLGRKGIISFWPSEAANKMYNNGAYYWTGDYFGFDAVVDFPTTKVYYFVMSSTSPSVFYVDCSSPYSPGLENTISTGGYEAWGYTIPAGKHIVHYLVKLGDNSTPLQNRSFGVEIYNNTFSEMTNADGAGTGLKILFSTKNFVGNNNVLSFFSDGIDMYTPYDPNKKSYHFYRYDGYPPFYNFSYCNFPIALKGLNPYTTGYLGNWRPYQTKVFQSSRNYGFSGNLNKAGVNVKDAGYLNGFNSYWTFNSGAWTANPNATKWVTANTVTLYDKYGQQLENKDALNRYSAAKFDFNGELPSAVASNAKNRDIYNATFEDSKFTPGQGGSQATTDIREFHNTTTGVLAKDAAINTLSHSGNYCTPLPIEGLTLSTVVHSREHKTEPYLVLDADKQYITQDSVNIYPNGFMPTGGKKYIFNAWVKDTHPEDKEIGFTVQTTAGSVPLTCKAVVEGWKLVEGIMDLTNKLNSALDIKIIPSQGATGLYLDDIRIHPFDAHMKTYAYDDKTMRLMAELDENGFATFYEYDDEGLLIRVKKETEKGVMTIKETRSAYKSGL